MRSAHQRTLKLLMISSLLALLFAVTISVQAQANATVSNAYVLNCRSGPGVSYGVVTRLNYGDSLTLIARNADATWVQATTFTGTTCWINRNYALTYIDVWGLPVGGVVTPPPPTTGNGVVNTPLLNLRTGPGANFNIVAKMPQGTTVTMVGRNADATWVQVNTGYGAGWVSNRYIASNINVAGLPVTNATGVTPGYTPPVTYEGQSGVVANAYFLNVRTGPSVWYPPVMVVAQGTPLRMLNRNANATWVLVQFYNGRTGWVNARYISTNYSVWNLPQA